MAEEKASTFQHWAKSIGGPKTVAKLIGVQLRTAQAWNASECAPSIENMRRLIILSEGKLSYQSIIESTAPFAITSVTPSKGASSHAQN